MKYTNNNTLNSNNFKIMKFKLYALTVDEYDIILYAALTLSGIIILSKSNIEKNKLKIKNKVEITNTLLKDNLI